MAARRRYFRPSAQEAEIGRRMLALRKDYRFHRREIAELVRITTDQLKRVERGEVALRFGIGWRFCQVTKANPLWLAFGDVYGRLGFAEWQIDVKQRSDDLFLDVMKDHAFDYDRFRTKRLRMSKETAEGFAMALLSKLDFLTDPSIKHYLVDDMPTKFTWEHLRQRLKVATSAKGMRTELAKKFRVTTAAVSQWLTGESAPKADTTLKLLQWVTVAEAQQKRTAELRAPGDKSREQ
jgi:transcriptional regulator with XRE-family HTH domain